MTSALIASDVSHFKGHNGSRAPIETLRSLKGVFTICIYLFTIWHATKLHSFCNVVVGIRNSPSLLSLLFALSPALFRNLQRPE